MKVLLISSGQCVRPHLARELLGAGHELLELDVSELRAEHATAGARGAWRPSALWELLSDHAFDAVVFVNDAGASVPGRTAPSGSESLRVLNDAMRLAKRLRARFVLASPSSRGLAARQRVCHAEALVSSFVESFALPAGIARLEGLYGGGLGDGSDATQLGALVRAGLSRRAVHLPTPWDGWLWPLHVQDAARGIHRLLLSGETAPITFAGASPYRMREVVATAERVLDAPLSVVIDRVDERRAGSPPAIASARRLLNWRPTVGLFAGLEDLVGAQGTSGRTTLPAALTA